MFVHFDFAMCFAPQRHALFRHLNFQKCSERAVLRATTACNFSSHLARWLRTRRFSEPTFRPSGATNHEKNTGDRDFSTLSHLFAHLHLLSSDSFSSLIFSLLLFSSLLFSSLSLPTSAFPSVHIVGSLTTKFLLWCMLWLVDQSRFGAVTAVTSKHPARWMQKPPDFWDVGQQLSWIDRVEINTLAIGNLWPFWLVFLTFWKSLEFHWKPSAGGFPRNPAASTPSVFPSGLRALPARSVLRDHLARLGLAHLIEISNLSYLYTSQIIYLPKIYPNLPFKLEISLRSRSEGFETEKENIGKPNTSHLKSSHVARELLKSQSGLPSHH